MRAITFTRNPFDADAGADDNAGGSRGTASTLLRMLLILIGGLVVTCVVAAALLGVATLIWGGMVGTLVQQLAGD
ncbi:MAG: hypothetical protein ACTHON_10755 [Humibacter sp.]